MRTRTLLLGSVAGIVLFAAVAQQSGTEFDWDSIPSLVPRVDVGTVDGATDAGVGSSQHSNGVTLTGTVTLAAVQDSDVNDPNVHYVSNDDAGSAQALSAPVSVVGYVNTPESGPGGRSFAQGDPVYWYAVTLTGSEGLLLEIADETEGNVALSLHDSERRLIVESNDVSHVQYLSPEHVAAPGDYLLRVSADSGASGYALHVAEGITAANQPRTVVPTSVGTLPLHVVLNVDGESYRTTAELQDGRGNFEFPALPAGLYSLFSGTDNDSVLCERGEVCARAVIGPNADTVGVEVVAEPFDQTLEVVAAADYQLGRIDAGQRARVLFDFGDDAQRARWSNFPTGPFRRAGLRMGDASESELDAVYAVVAATLNRTGFRQVVETVTGDEVLGQLEGGNGPPFSAAEYYFSILGTPSTTEPWMWQFGGHHLALNATVVGREISLTPALTGAEPMRYEIDGQETHQFKEENDMGFAIINALDSAQQDKAMQGSRYIDLVLGAGRDDRTQDLQPEGISASEMTPAQRELLVDLIGLRVNLLNPEDAAYRMAEIENHLDNTRFAWYGPTENGQGAYFRVHGPTIIIEYAPQEWRESQEVNHIHAMYRDPTNDYGSSLLN